jgi:hypothetical protein
VAKKNESVGNTALFTRIWEDTVILALRDLQWVKARPGRPAGLLKLDGNVETALGDAITSAGGRYFLFEFKSDAKLGGSEFRKPLVTLMKRVGNLPGDSDAKKYFENATRAAHHFVFPEFGPVERSEGETPLRRASVRTDCYYDAACAMKSDTYVLSAKVDVEDMLYATQNQECYGLNALEMAAYLAYLCSHYEEWTARKSGTTGGADESDTNAPLKALVLSDKGFFWPCASMNDVRQVYQVLTSIQPHVDLQSHLKLASYPGLSLPPAPDEPDAPAPTLSAKSRQSRP